MSVDLRCGDCLELMKTVPEESVDCVVTDPPYRTITGGDSGNRPKGMLSGNGKLFIHQTDIEIGQWMPIIYKVLKDGCHAYIFSNALNLYDMITEGMRAGFKMHNLLVWEKNNKTPSQYYMKNCEYVLFMRKGRAKYINNIGESNTVHKFNNIIGKKVHPCEKPVELLRFYIENSTQIGDTVLDPFVGSGSCGVACVRTNRNFIGFEKDEGYFAIAKIRIEKELATPIQEVFG